MDNHSASKTEASQFLARPEGRVAYDVDGNGPLVVLVPGVGELRSTYRFLAPMLQQAGFRVATVDLRGHGGSDTTFGSYGDVETASDVVALIETLGGPAVIVGNSMAGGASVIAAADRPELIRALVLVGPYVRNAEVGAMYRLLLRVAMTPLWAGVVWKSYMPKLYAGRRPSDFDDYRDRVVKSIRRPGYAKAFSLTTRVNHDVAETRLGEVVAPTLVVMGDKDPDFKNPSAEAEWIASTLKGSTFMVSEAGHYPQSQQPEITAGAVLAFLNTLDAHA